MSSKKYALGVRTIFLILFAISSCNCSANIFSDIARGTYEHTKYVLLPIRKFLGTAGLIGCASAVTLFAAITLYKRYFSPFQNPIRLMPARPNCATDHSIDHQTFDSIDAIMLNAVQASRPFGGHLPAGYSYQNPYPQLLSQTLHEKTSDEINRMIDGIIRNNVHADRSVGALMGLLVGDAVGAPLEFLPAQTNISYLSVGSNNRITYSRFLNNFDLKPGQWTDDGSMALCLADSLIVSGTRPFLQSPRVHPGSYDGSDCRIRYYLWWNTGYNNAFEYDGRRPSVGLGGNIAKSFNEIAANPQHVSEMYNANDNDSGNGSIMRNAPVAIRFSSNMAEAIDVARRQSKGTHPGEDAAACCVFMTYITIKAIQRDQSQVDIKTFVDTSIATFINEIVSNHRENPSFQKLANVLNVHPSTAKEAVWNWKNDRLQVEETLAARGHIYNGYPVSAGYFGSYCMDGLAMALWALYHAESFEQAIIRCVNLCGDADTVGAICGQIAGAFFGYRAMLSSPVGLFLIMNMNPWDPQHEIPLRALMLYHLSLLR